MLFLETLVLGAVLTTPPIGVPTLPGYPPSWAAPPWLVPAVTIAEEGEFLRVEIAEGATAWDLAHAAKPFLEYPCLRSDPGDPIAPSDVVCAVDVVDQNLGDVESVRIDRRELWSFFGEHLSRAGLKPVVYGRGHPGSYVRVRPAAREAGLGVVVWSVLAASVGSPVTITEDGDFLRVDFAEGTVLGDFLRASRSHLLESPSPNFFSPPPPDPSEQPSRSIFFELRDLESVAVGIQGVRRVHSREYSWFFCSLMRARGVALWRTFDGSGVAIGLTSPEIAEARQRASRRVSCSWGTVAPVIGLDDLFAYSTDAGLIVTTSMILKSAHPQEVVNRLQPTFSDPMISSIRAVMQSRAIVVTGEAPQVCRAVGAVKLLDAAASAPDLIWECTTSVFR